MYRSPEHSYYEMTVPCLRKLRKRTGLNWLYSTGDRLTRHSPDVLPGAVSSAIINEIDKEEETDDATT